jgi:hypothetical protein
MAVCLLALGSSVAVRVVPIGNKSFKSADAYRLTLDTSYTLRLALCFLGTNSTANCRKAGAFCNNLICALKVALFNSINKFGDMYIYGTTADAWHILAGEATKRLIDCGSLVIAEGNLTEIFATKDGILGRHNVLLRIHICHNQFSSFLKRLQAFS